MNKIRWSLRYYSDTLEDGRNSHAAEKRSHAATKGQLTKIRKRAEAGVCTQCNRTFANATQVQRHMATKHKGEAQ